MGEGKSNSQIDADGLFMDQGNNDNCSTKYINNIN